MTLPPPRIATHEGVRVVRDDDIPGGTKRRVVQQIVAQQPDAEFVYASPAYGYAQVALAYSCAAAGKRATVFVAKRKEPHPRTKAAHVAGARVVQVPHGYLSNVQAKAREYAREAGAFHIPFGVDTPEVRDAIADVARTLGPQQGEVWCVAGSGTLTHALQLAWPQADHHAVRVGANANVGNATLHEAVEPFERPANHPPPFPSCDNYDAKAWRFLQGRHGALFWNVAA